MSDGRADGPAADASLPGTNNPVLPGYTADPNVALFDDTFYIYATSDGFAGWGATSFRAFSSPNLVKWTDRGVVLDVKTSLTWASGYSWAPSIARVNGTYYYARAQTPLGPFTRVVTILQQDTSIGVLGPGGGTVLGIPGRDEYYLAYHRFKIPGGDGYHRETCIDRMSFAADGAIVPVKPTLAGLQAAVMP